MKAIEGLKTEQGDIAKIKGSDFYRLKIDHYRIIFSYDSERDVACIEEINTRTNIKYKEWRK
jgi:mRNA-degrading endonuclease RelE of RelBE toxin-antitoxin system